MNPTEAVKTCLAGRIRIQAKNLGFVFIRMNVQLGALIEEEEKSRHRFQSTSFL